jgi:hypothetical protein
LYLLQIENSSKYKLPATKAGRPTRLKGGYEAVNAGVKQRKNLSLFVHQLNFWWRAGGLLADWLGRSIYNLAQNDRNDA